MFGRYVRGQPLHLSTASPLLPLPKHFPLAVFPALSCIIICATLEPLLLKDTSSLNAPTSSWCCWECFLKLEGPRLSRFVTSPLTIRFLHHSPKLQHPEGNPSSRVRVPTRFWKQILWPHRSLLMLAASADICLQPHEPELHGQAAFKFRTQKACQKSNKWFFFSNFQPFILYWGIAN